MHAQSEAVQEALAAQFATVGLHPAVHLPVRGEREKREGGGRRPSEESHAVKPAAKAHRQKVE